VPFTLCYLGLCRILGLLRSSRRTETDKDIEVMVLRHQVRILERQVNARVAYRPVDRAILAALSRLLSRWRWRSFLVTPETLLRWHRELSRRKWRRWRSTRGPGRPPMSDELGPERDRLSLVDPVWPVPLPADEFAVPASERVGSEQAGETLVERTEPL
jgi:hypothetical protein